MNAWKVEDPVLVDICMVWKYLEEGIFKSESKEGAKGETRGLLRYRDKVIALFKDEAGIDQSVPLQLHSAGNEYFVEMEGEGSDKQKSDKTDQSWVIAIQ